MATLAEILQDPNYVNANAATKKAIFDKYSAGDPNYTNANEATQQAIRAQFGIEQAAQESPPSNSTEPATQGTPEKRGLASELGRQLGLTGRAVVEGNPAVALADTIAAPLRWAVNTVRPGTLMPGGEALADLMHLPKPENKLESVVQAYSQALAGSAGSPMLAKAAPYVTESARPILTWLSEKPRVQVNSALGATTGALAAREAGLGPTAQMAAALAGGVAGPGIDRAIRIGAEPFFDIGATVGASFGNKRGIRRLETDAVERGLGGQKDRVRAAVLGGTEYVPGAKPTVAEAIAEANAKSPDQFGGWAVRLQKDLTGAKGVEDVLPSVSKEQAAAVASETARVNRELWPVGKRILESANAYGGVSAKRILSTIDGLLSQPQSQGSTLIKRVLTATKRKVSGLVRDDGSIDAEALYALRKELGNDIKTQQRVTNNWDRKVSGGLERDIQRVMDDAIESSGGSGWRAEYMDPYAARMAQIGKHEARTADVKRIGAQVKPTGGPNVVPGEIPTPPTLLNRTMMFANYGLRMLAKDANDPVVKDLAKRLADPKAFAELLMRPDKDPLKMRAMEAVKRGQIAAAMTQHGE